MAKETMGGLDQAFLRWQFGLSISKQLVFLEDLVRLMNDGIPLGQALEYFSRVGSPMDRSVALTLLRGLDEGGTITDAMLSHFKFEVTGAFGAAQQGGDLSETGLPVLQRLRDQYEARKGALAQLIKPSLYVLFACILYAGFAMEIWPRFEEAGDIEDWPALARTTYEIGSFIEQWWVGVLGGLAGLALVTRTLLRRWVGIGRKWLDRIWPFTLYRGLLAANALDELGTLLIAG